MKWYVASKLGYNRIDACNSLPNFVVPGSQQQAVDSNGNTLVLVSEMSQAA